jgi:hypothetical protein
MLLSKVIIFGKGGYYTINPLQLPSSALTFNYLLTHITAQKKASHKRKTYQDLSFLP